MLCGLIARWFDISIGDVKPCSCGNPAREMTTKCEEFGVITGHSAKCDICKEKEYQSYLEDLRKQKYEQDMNLCCGFQNKLAKVNGEAVEWDSMREYVSQKSLTNYVNSVIARETNKGAYISGRTGTGKSYWCKLLTNALIYELRNVCYIRAVDLALSLRKEAFADRYKQVLGEFAGVDVLIVDDFGTQKNTEWVSETMYAIFDKRYEDGKITIITSNILLSELEHDRLSSRFSDGKWMEKIYIEGADIRRKL